jgi:hypothetical protein
MIACILLLTGFSVAAADSQADEKAVLAVVQQLLDAIGKHDSAAAKAVLVPEGRYFSVRETDKLNISGKSHAEMIERLTSSTELALERMFDPKVLIRGRIAMVWTEYDFHRSGAFSHCGVDAFSLLKTADGWKIAGFIYTVEPSGCPDRPAPR